MTTETTTTQGPGILARLDTDAQADIASGQVAVNGVSPQAAFANAVTGSPISQVAYTVSCALKGVGGSVGKVAHLRIWALGGATATNFNMINVVAPLTAGWQYFSGSAVVDQPDRTELRVNIFLEGVSGDVFLVDSVQLELGSTPTRHGVAA